MSILQTGGGDLLHEILTSRHFAHAGTLKRVLLYLYERSAYAAARSPKEYEIAVEAMGRAPDFDPQLDPVVRVTVSQIRKRLSAFFASEGAGLPWRLEIPPGRYVTVIRPNDRTHSRDSSARCLLQFWGQHKQNGRSTLILYTEPLFFTDSRGLFVRHWQLNQESDSDRLSGMARRLDAESLEPMYHYLSAGEMRCLLSLSRCLTALGIPADFRSTRHCQPGELGRCNAVLLGSPRTNPFLEEMQRELPLRASTDAIELWQGGRRKHQWRDDWIVRSGQRRLRCRAVISRIRAPETGAVHLLIASNHGAAIEGTGHSLTLEETVEEVLRRTGAMKADALPSFQLLVEVVANGLDGEILDVAFRQMVVLPEARAVPSAAVAMGGRSRRSV